MADNLWRTKLQRSEKLEVRRSPVHRWGVFAIAPIRKYEVLEECPYFSERAELLQASGRAYDYTYWLNDESLLIAMGLSGMYNHSSEANTSYEVDRINEVLRHYATRDIAAGEELTLDYGPENVERLSIEPTT